MLTSRASNVLHCFVASACWGLINLMCASVTHHPGPCCCLTDMLRARARQLSFASELAFSSKQSVTLLQTSYLPGWTCNRCFFSSYSRKHSVIMILTPSVAAGNAMRGPVRDGLVKWLCKWALSPAIGIRITRTRLWNMRVHLMLIAPRSRTQLLLWTMQCAITVLLVTGRL